MQQAVLAFNRSPLHKCCEKQKMLAWLTVCERKREIEIMKVQEAVAVYGVETVSIKDLFACIIGDEIKAAKICDNNNEVFKMLNRTVDAINAIGLT